MLSGFCLGGELYAQRLCTRKMHIVHHSNRHCGLTIFRCRLTMAQQPI